jgi:serine O-acetyltransferase
MDQARLEKIYQDIMAEKNAGIVKSVKNLNKYYVIEVLLDVKKFILNEYFEETISFYKIGELQAKVQSLLESTKDFSVAEKDSIIFLETLPQIKRLIHQDIEAAFQKDPAANSHQEIALTYPGVFSIVVHRISNQLFNLGYLLIARMMSEYAHGKTGIDIHPGAIIGDHFFMDHGTGIVIGETTKVGNNVTLYQGVTLGAFSFQRDDKGYLVKGQKRHPSIEDDVTIYAGATILGGDTVIGKGSIIGGNVWLTRSVPPFSKVQNVSDSKVIPGAESYSIAF